jgi:hypothetical protein
VKPQLTFPRADYTERRKIERRKGKCPESKFLRICSEECFHREEKA